MVSAGGTSRLREAVTKRRDNIYASEFSFAAGPGEIRRLDLSWYSFPLSHLWNLTTKELNPSDLKENSWQHNQVGRCASV